MKTLIAHVVIAALLAPTVAVAQSNCVGTPDHFLVWGDPGGSIVYGPIVPQAETWLVDAAGLMGGDGASSNSEFMMEVIEPIPEQTGLVDSADPNRCCWRIPVGKITGVYATPLMALSRQLVLRPGQRMAGRTNNPTKFGITGTFWRYPAFCAAGLVRPMASTAPSPPVIASNLGEIIAGIASAVRALPALTVTVAGAAVTGLPDFINRSQVLALIQP